MSIKQPYRNALRSKKMIKVAFLQLVSQKEITKIKVKEIIDLADISKGTFYAHYQDVYAIWREIETENIDRMILFLNNQPSEDLLEDITPLISQIFLHIDENQEFYQILFRSQMANSFSSKLQKVFVDYMMSNKKMLSQLKGETQANMYFSFIAAGTANLIHEILTGSNDIPAHEIISIFNSCIIHGVSTIKK